MSMEDLNLSLEPAKNKPHKDGIWRQRDSHFRKDEPGFMAFPGLVTLGIRQSQGFEVCTPRCDSTVLNLSPETGRRHQNCGRPRQLRHAESASSGSTPMAAEGLGLRRPHVGSPRYNPS